MIKGVFTLIIGLAAMIVMGSAIVGFFYGSAYLLRILFPKVFTDIEKGMIVTFALIVILAVAYLLGNSIVQGIGL